jgi:hypothetical protein
MGRVGETLNQGSDLMIEKDMLMNRCQELSTGCYESSEIFPSDRPATREGAGLKSLRSLGPYG